MTANRVAELAGVSRSAVSRTFTDGASVSPETRAKVLAAAAKLGYHVNHLARGLIQHRSGIVCIIVPELQAPFQAGMVELLIRRLQDIGKVVMVLSSAGRSENAAAALRQTLNYRAEATVVISGAPPQALIETCIENGQRVILINRDDPVAGPEFVQIDNQAAAVEAARLLIGAGCTRLGVVTSTAGTPALVTRERAFIAEAKAHGFEVSVHAAGPTGYEAGAASARAVLAQQSRPDGIFCVTDLLATGVLDVARHDFGMRLPEDLSVIGFDDIPQAGWRSYDLTTFRQPIDAVAEKIATALASGQELDRSMMRPQVVWRGTVRGAPDPT